MKKETANKKGKLWLIIAIAVVAVLAIVGGILAFTMLGGQSDEPEKIESKLYWNIDRESMIDKESMLTLRKPAEDGLYYLRFAVEGEQVELPCADKKLVNRIDLLGDVVGLKFDADGIIIEAYKAKDFATAIVENAYVQAFNGNVVTTNSSMTLNGMEVDVDISNANVYIVEDPRPEVPGRDFTIGAKDELKLMDTIIAFGTEDGVADTVFVADRLYDSKVYWRYSAQEYDSTNKVSSRKLADDGYWYMDFLCEGEIVTVRTADQACINAMDGYGIVSCACGLVFDKNGDVVDVFNAGLAVKGSVAANNYDVTAIDGTMVTLTRKLNGTELGRTYMLNMAEEFPIYNVTTTAEEFGELTDLQIGDRVYLLADSTGKPVQAYITCRLVDSPMYYNVSQKYDTNKKETTRTPDASGWYTIELAVGGKLKTFRCKDKAIMTQIDAYGNKVFGLKVAGDKILKAYNPECVTGAYSFASNNWVTSIAGEIVGTQNAQGVATNGIMAPNCEVYDVSGCADHIGAKATLREGDRIFAYNTPDATMRYIYIISRKVDGVSLYWNFEKKYDAVKQQTTRTPDADGYYVFRMAKCGSAGEKFMKTKDIKIASQIDKTGVYALCLKAKGDIITSVYPATAINAGYSRIYGIYATEQTDDTHFGAMFYTTGATANLDISEAKIYNVSGVYKKGAGEITKLQRNDRLMLLYGASGKAEHILVFERECGSSAYWQFNPNYNAQARTTEPDENGYYNYTVTSQGKIKNVKTKDKEIAAYMDGRFLAFGLKLDGDIIKGAYPAVATKEIQVSGVSYYDVTKIKGNKITVERTTPGSSNTGDVKEIDISKAKVYNVSAYAGDAWGKAAKLGIGDRIQTYINEKSETTLVYIVWENTREAGHKSYCEHCKQEVFWHPYYGTIDFIDKHYYLPADYQNKLSKGWGIQGRESGWDWVLDLNGFTYEATDSYAFAVRGNSTLTVVDTSKAQTGRITGYGVQVQIQVENADGTMEVVKSQYQSSQAGIFRVLDGGVLNLRGGTYTHSVNRDITNLRRGGVVVVENDTKSGRFGTLNIYDGAKLVNNTMDAPLDLATTCPDCGKTTLKRVVEGEEERNLCKDCGWTGKNEVRRAPQGGAIYNAGGVVNIYGGLIANNGKIHEDFKEFESTAVGNGGNIFNASGELNIYGGKIIGGWCVGNGGNIYVTSGKLNIAGGEISGGTSVNGVDNIIVAANNNVDVTIAGGKITGEFKINSGNNLKISGKPVVSMGTDIGLFLGNGVKADVGTMEKGAKIVISSAGKFTTDFASAADAQAMIDNGYFVSATKENPVYVDGKALACGVAKCLNGHTSEEACKAAGCKEEMLYWFAWKASDKLPDTGNYYLTQDVTIDEVAQISDNVNLDLNGFNITRNVTAQQIADGEAIFVYRTLAGKKLAIADLSGKNATVKTVLPKDAEGNVIPATGSTGIINIATGAELAIYSGTFDGREMITESNASGGIFCGGGNVTVNGGTFYGWSHKFGASGNTENGTGGMGTIFGGWSTSVLTINDGTFYGGKTKMGGMFASTGKIVINGGTFNGEGTEVTHGGLFLVQDNANAVLEINGGTFTAPKCNTSGGIIYTTADAGGLNNVKINGGNYTLGKAYNGGFIRFRGKNLELTNVKLSGSTATIGDIIAFNSTGTLTIGKNANIDGGIECVAVGETVGNVVVKDNAVVGAGVNYGLKLAYGMKIDATGLNNKAKIAVNAIGNTVITTDFANAAAAKAIADNKNIYSADPNYEIVVKGKALMLKALASIRYSCLNGHVANGVGQCAECDLEILEWKMWTSANSLPIAGNYYLTKDVTLTVATEQADNLNLDLNGFNVTRNVTAQQIADGVNPQVIRTLAGKKLAIADLSGNNATVKTVHPADASLTSSTGIVYVATGATVEIYGGTFDGRELVTESNASGGIFCGGGNVTVNGGTFYGWSHKYGASGNTENGTGGMGTIFGGWSTSVLTINDGTFYGGKTKMGGMFASTGKIVINGGTFNGEGTEVTHGGLFLVQDNANAYLEIKGGTFTAPKCNTSGGMIYSTADAGGLNTVKINGGTYTLDKAYNGGFIRFRGKDLELTNVKLSGSTATIGDIIAFNSTGTLTIGKNANIDGGIECVAVGETVGNVVVKDNAVVGAGVNYGLKLANGMKIDATGLNNKAKVAVTATGNTVITTDFADAAAAKAIADNKNIYSADPNYEIVVKGKALMLKALASIRYSCLNGHSATATGTCATCGLEILEWKMWTSADTLPTAGNYYLTKDVTLTVATEQADNLNLDLNGFNVTRNVTAQQIADGVNPQVIRTLAGKKLAIADLSGNNATVKTVHPADASLTSSTGIVYVATGATVEIYGGTFDGRELVTESNASGGIFCGGGNVTVNGGTFYGWSHKYGAAGNTEETGAPGGMGTVFGGWSTSVLTINDGTFYGGKTKMGGMFASNGKIVINGGTFNGEGTEVAHGGLILVQDNANAYLEINGGTFTAPKCGTSGGMIYTTADAGGLNTVKISGGTFTLGQAGNGDFMRFRGASVEITGVELKGTVGRTLINMNSTGTLTVGKDTVLEGGLLCSAAANVVLKDNAKVNAITLGTAKLDIAGLNDQAKIYINYKQDGVAFAEAKDEATAQQLVDNKIIVSADANYAVVANGKNLTVKLIGLPSSGKIVLNDNLTLADVVTLSGDLEIDLNGFDITRNVTEQQITDGATTCMFAVPAGMKLTIIDSSVQSATDIPGTVKVVLPKDADDKIIPVTSSTGIINVATGSEVVIDNGIYDGREMITSSAASGGLFCGGGKLTINGGTFYGWSNKDGAANGNGSVFGGWSTSVLTINGGTFYSGDTKQGGLFASTGKIVINDGTFDGTGSQVTHGGLILAQANNNSYVEINGGTFTAPSNVNSGGTIYVEAGNGVVNINGGTFQAIGKAMNGGFIRFRGKDLTITGVKLEGFGSSNAANGDIVSFEGNGTLTIGKDAVVDGGIMVKSATKLVLQDNVQIGKGASYPIVLATGASMDLNGLNTDAKVYIKHAEIGVAFAELADAATAETLVNNKIVESADENYVVIADGNKLTVKEFDGFKQWTSGDSLPTSGKYILTKNVVVSETCELSGNLELDLNGFSITRNVTEQQITDAAKTYVFHVPAAVKLTIIDSSVVDPATDVPGTVKAVLPKDADDKIIPVTSTTGIVNVATGSEVVINNGIFDGREMITSSTAAGGLFCGGGKLTINGGTFYGWSNKDGASNGIGSVFGGWSTSVLTIEGGTFYGGKTKQGGMFASTGKIVINGGIFDGNNSATNAIIDNTKPRTEVTHGGLILAQANNNSYVEINGGTFTAPRTGNSGGIIYVEAGNGVVKINGGTFALSSAGNGGFIRFRGKTLEIQGVTLTGGRALAGAGDIINMNSTGTLTIGKDAVINGGVELSAAAKLVLKENVKIGEGTNYGLKLGTGVLDISELGAEAQIYIDHTDMSKAFVTAADEATAKALLDNKNFISGDANYRLAAIGNGLWVKKQITWNEWNAAAAATMYGGAEADNLHLTKLPTAGDYKLIADVTVTSRTAMTGNVNLNLNGFTVTRVIKSGAADYGVYTTNAKGNLYITDEIKDTNPSATVGTMTTVFDTGVTTCAGTGFLGYVGAGYSITIDEGNFDFRGVKTTASATTGAGAIIVDGTLTINGGTFYGANAGTTGYGTVIGGRSANVITINGGTFYGNNAKQGGIISTTGNLTINGGLFDGNTNASNGKVNADLPQAVATHGGLFYVAKALTITGGEFKAGRVSGSGGVAYVTGSNSVVSGGTYTAGGQTNYAGFFRFDGSATITGVTLSGGKATTNGNNIAFGSNGNATLTIGQDAVIDGGIMFRNDKTGNKLVLVGNAQVNGGTGAAYSLNLANATVHIGDVTSAAVATVGSTFADYIATYDAAGNVTGVQAK